MSLHYNEACDLIRRYYNLNSVSIVEISPQIPNYTLSQTPHFDNIGQLIKYIDDQLENNNNKIAAIKALRSYKSFPYGLKEAKDMVEDWKDCSYWMLNHNCFPIIHYNSVKQITHYS